MLMLCLCDATESSMYDICDASERLSERVCIDKVAAAAVPLFASSSVVCVVGLPSPSHDFHCLILPLLFFPLSPFAR